MLDCSHKVFSNEKDIILLEEQIKEIKKERDKGNTTVMWLCGMGFTIIMAVAGFGIQSNADIQVLQEKVKEQKAEIEKLSEHVHTHD